MEQNIFDYLVEGLDLNAFYTLFFPLRLNFRCKDTIFFRL